MRGETVDFDLMDIKNRIMTAPTPDTVHQRERFIDKRRRRGSRKKIDDMVSNQQTTAIEEQRKKNQEEKESVPHVVIPDTVIDAEAAVAGEAVDNPVSEDNDSTQAKTKRKIVKQKD